MIHVILLLPTDLVLLYLFSTCTVGCLLGQVVLLLTGERAP